MKKTIIIAALICAIFIFAFPALSANDALLMETGDTLLMETGDKILLETGEAVSRRHPHMMGGGIF